MATTCQQRNPPFVSHLKVYCIMLTYNCVGTDIISQENLVIFQTLTNIAIHVYVFGLLFVLLVFFFTEG